LNTAVSELSSLEYHCDVPIFSQFISIKRDRQHIDEVKANLAENLNFMYKELTAYLNKLGRVTNDE